MSNGLIVHSGGKKVARQNLVELETPVSEAASHVILPHHELVQMVEESLGYRGITIEKDEYAIAKQGLRLFGMLTLSIKQDGINLVMGLRNSHDKSFSLGIVAGFRVFVCDNLAFYGDFESLSKKHSKNLLKGTTLTDAISIGVDRTQRQFQPMIDKINRWQDFSLSDGKAKDKIYDAFIMGQLDAPERLAGLVHKEYFEPRHEEFSPRNMWSLHNAFTQVFGDELDPMPQYKALASLDDFLQVDGKPMVTVPKLPDIDIVAEPETL